MNDYADAFLPSTDRSEISVILTCVGPGTCKLSHKLDDRADGNAQAKELPLAKLSGTFTKIRLSLPLGKITPMGEGSVLRKCVTGLLAGQVMLTPTQPSPTVVPNAQYGMHEALCADSLEHVYQKIVVHSTNPSPLLGKLFENVMPLDFIVGNSSYRLTSSLHFIDAANGEARGDRGGSSWNDEEVEVINALVLQAIKKGVERKSIAVMTGYVDQQKKLTRKAEANGWHDIQVIPTVDSSQGAEYKIVILSLVRRSGPHSPKVKLEPANVATSG